MAEIGQRPDIERKVALISDRIVRARRANQNREILLSRIRTAAAIRLDPYDNRSNQPTSVSRLVDAQVGGEIVRKAVPLSELLQQTYGDSPGTAIEDALSEIKAN